MQKALCSAKAVLRDEVPANKLEGHVVFIGTSAIGLKDMRATPVEADDPLLLLQGP